MGRDAFGRFISTKPLVERFWDKVHKGGLYECWEWEGWRFSKSNYGGFDVGGESVGAHKIAYELSYGEILPGMHVLHSCDNPPCCNPFHLRMGTPQDNMNDKMVRGRGGQLSGEQQPNSKLTQKQVTEIRERYIPRQVTMQKLSDEYGVKIMEICRIIHNERWKE